MKGKLDFEMLKNGDDETLKEISKFAKVSEADMEKIFLKSRKKYKTAMNDNTESVKQSDEVSGVEVYRKPKWHKLAAAVSALVLTVGIVGGGVFIISNFGGDDVINYSNYEEPEETTAEIILPFKGISDDKMRMIAPPDTSEFVEPEKDDIQRIDEVCRKYPWTETKESDFSGDQFVTTVMYNNGDPYILAFFANGLVNYRQSGKETNYRVSDEVYAVVREVYEKTYAEENFYVFENQSDLLEDIWNEENVRKKYAELELHQEPLDFKNDDEHQEFLMNNTFTCDFLKKSGCVNKTPYIENIITDSGEERNSLENKSYIYHMMLNSIDYFNTVKGEIHYNSSYGENGESIWKFQTDMMNGYSFEETNNTANYIYDNTYYRVFDSTHEYLKADLQSSYEYESISDNYRLGKNAAENYYYSFGRQSYTLLSYADSYIFPQYIAMSHLAEFDLWEITGTGEKCGRTCAVIEGRVEDVKADGADFDYKMYVDLETGIIMDYRSYDLNGDPLDFTYMAELETDVFVDKVKFNSESYTEIEKK